MTLTATADAPPAAPADVPMPPLPPNALTSVETLTLGRMSYQLRRLRLHGLIARVPKSHRYRLTPLGLRTALFFTRSYGRLLRPAYAETVPEPKPAERPVARAFARLAQAMDVCCAAVHLTAAA